MAEWVVSTAEWAVSTAGWEVSTAEWAVSTAEWVSGAGVLSAQDFMADLFRVDSGDFVAASVQETALSSAFPVTGLTMEQDGVTLTMVTPTIILTRFIRTHMLIHTQMTMGMRLASRHPVRK